MQHLTLALLALARLASADGPVVNNANFLEWDHELASAAETEEYRVYCDRSPGVLADPTKLVATVPRPALPTSGDLTASWPINGVPQGQWRCVVTAYDADANIESAVSNEVPFVIFAAPSNLRVRDDDGV